MSEENLNKNLLSVLSDEELIVETAKRLQKIHKSLFGDEFRWGCLNYLYNDGQLLGVQSEYGKTLFVR
jgi:hypothetical protein